MATKSKKKVKHQASNLKRVHVKGYTVSVEGKVYAVKAANAIEAGVKANILHKKEKRS